MKVYLVKSICDYEYGYRVVQAVCATKESAEIYIEEHGGNFSASFGTEQCVPFYIIEEWEVKDES